MKGVPTALRLVYIGLVLGVSLIPAALSVRGPAPDLEKVDEMRRLAEWPSAWDGRPWDIDRNFASFDRWFNDNMAYRSLMIRTKNQLDYWLFRSSTRAYFGGNGEIYGRKLLDEQLPTNEALFRLHADTAADGIAKLRDALAAQGVRLLVITPGQREHFSQERVPFFAPHMTEPSQFLSKLRPAIHQRLGADFIDAHTIMESLPADQPLFFKQDFHWSDFAARAVSMKVAERIATIEGAPFQWQYPLETYVEQEVGSDARFAALLLAEPVDELRVDNRKWPAVHQIQYQDTPATGLEYITDDVDTPGLLPATCLYGNSFSDGMVGVGFLNHFRKMVRIGRDVPITDLPRLANGQCTYMVVQLLDISPEWARLAND